MKSRRIAAVIATLSLWSAALLGGCAAKSARSISGAQVGGAAGGGAGSGSLARFKGEASSAGDSALPRLAAGEELWIVADASRDGATSAGEGPQRLETRLLGHTETVPLPLTHTDVRADVSGTIASVSVTQRYENPYTQKIEAVYVFPLPENAAVKEFVMRIGARRIRSIVRKREDAQRLYGEAKRQGYVAALLTEERPNVFRQAIANIEPKQGIDIDITYFQTVRYDAGEFEWVFPMVVGPRYEPPGRHAGDGAVLGAKPFSRATAEIPYLRAGERSGYDVNVRVDLDAGAAIDQVTSPSHAVDVKVEGPNRRLVTLRHTDSMANQDFRLRYRLAGSDVKPALVTHSDARGDFFSLMLVPPASMDALPRVPLELVFVIDCSGSMDGAPLAIAKGAVERALGRLDPNDTFQIIQFSQSASSLGPVPIAATPENVARGRTYLKELGSEGGTMMIEGVRAALDFPHDPARMRIVSFMTDGFIGNEAQILAEVHRRIGQSRIFSFGIGSSTNRYLLEQLAAAGRGAAAFVGVNETAARAVDGFYEAAAHPALTDVEIDWGGTAVEDVFPARTPDLFVGRPIVLDGRFRGKLPETLRIRGQRAGKREEFVVHIEPEKERRRHQAVADLWARAKIGSLDDDEIRGTGRMKEITELALGFGLASAYTSFVAVDSSTQTAGEPGSTVVQPVPVPAGTSFGTTGERRDAEPPPQPSNHTSTARRIQ